MRLLLDHRGEIHELDSSDLRTHVDRISRTHPGDVIRVWTPRLRLRSSS